MRTLERNKRTFHYASITGRDEIIDDYGNATGQYAITYGDPVEARGCVVARSGQFYVDGYGKLEVYDKSIALASRPSGLDEYSRIWLDKPVTGEHDYVVVRINEWINSCVVYVRSVDVSGVGDA